MNSIKSWLEAKRGRIITIVELPTLPGNDHCGMWVSYEHLDVVLHAPPPYPGPARRPIRLQQCPWVMNYVPAAMPWLLTIIRIPTASDEERASVLSAPFFAALACTLFTPAVYTAADPTFGGHHRVGLLLVVTVMAGFWQFHTATILAGFTNQARLRRHLMRGRLVAAVAGTCVVGGIFRGRVQVTDPGTLANTLSTKTP